MVVPHERHHAHATREEPLELVEVLFDRVSALDAGNPGDAVRRTSFLQHRRVSGEAYALRMIVGETMKRYHPHGDAAIYPTLVRMAQEWNMRHVLIDKQGNFGSVAGLPPAAMRYTEARMSPVAAAMLEDLKLDTVDYVPTYDERRTEPTVLPSKYFEP